MSGAWTDRLQHYLPSAEAVRVAMQLADHGGDPVMMQKSLGVAGDIMTLLTEENIKLWGQKRPMTSEIDKIIRSRQNLLNALQNGRVR